MPVSLPKCLSTGSSCRAAFQGAKLLLSGIRQPFATGFLTPDFGNLLIFRGPCACESLRAQLVYTEALARIFTEAPDLPGAERLLRESIRLDPSPFFAYIDLGNLLLKRGAREDALKTYSEALKRVPGNPEISRAIEEQIARVSSEPLNRIPELRDPFLE